MNGTWSIRGLEQGLGTDYCLVGEVGGLGQIIADNDVEFSTENGAWPGSDRYSSRVLTFPMTIAPPMSHLMQPEERRRWTLERLHALTAAWAKVNEPVEGFEIPLDLRIDGLSPTDELRFYGRPRGPLAIDSTLLHSAGAVRVRAQFGCLDPLGYGAEVNVTLPVGTTNVENEGLAATERWQAVFPVGAVNPTLTHVATGVGLDVTTTIATGPYVADGRWYTLTQNSVNDVFVELTDTSDFFVLAPGSNNLAVTGDEVDFTYRPAWLI